ncbi:MAG: 30S ribosomal protein S18 [Armatimonadetes bacterium]|nr:30S ribosomal protein S18 [Armatimonadota bacterium]
MSEEETTQAQPQDTQAAPKPERSAPKTGAAAEKGPAEDTKKRAGTEEVSERKRPAGPRRDTGAGRPTGPRAARGRKRRKVSYLTINKVQTVDYKDVELLRRYLNDQGRILPARQTGNTAKQQRMIARAIRRAREMALLPFVALDINRMQWKPTRERRRPPAPQKEPATEPASE